MSRGDPAGTGTAAARATHRRYAATSPRQREGDMSSQQQTQDIIRQLSDMFSPRLKEIQDKLDTLVTRREHEKDLAEVSADISNQQKQLDRLQTWADQRPRHSADVERVDRLERDIRTIETRMASQPEEARQWFSTFTQGGGCLYMAVSLITSAIIAAISIGVTLAIALHH